MGRTRKENAGSKKKALSLKKEDMQWLSSNTQFDKEHIKQWHKVIIFIEDNLAL